MHRVIRVVYIIIIYIIIIYIIIVYIIIVYIRIIVIYLFIQTICNICSVAMMLCLFCFYWSILLIVLLLLVDFVYCSVFIGCSCIFFSFHLSVLLFCFCRSVLLLSVPTRACFCCSIRPGRIVLVTAGRHAGQKALVVSFSESGNRDRPFSHVFVVGVERGPLKVHKRMPKKKIERRTNVKAFFKYLNCNHVVPTRY